MQSNDPPQTARLADGGKWYGTDGDLFGGAGLAPWTSMAEALGWGFDTQPSPTVTAGGTEQGGVEVFGNAGTRRRLREVVVRQKHDYGAGMVERHGDRPGRAIDEPSLAVTAGTKGSGPRLLWVHERPATTAQGDPRIAQPGHWDREGGERQFAGESIRITVEEAAALQSFPPGYPWHGRVGDKHRQVGDAVPPLLAAHVIATCLGVQVDARERAA